MTDLYLVTGATDGIGRALAIALAEQGAEVVLHGRNAGKLAAAASAVRNVATAPVHTVQADFASLDAVAALAADVTRRFTGLSVLVNNAGLLTDHRQESADGFELTFAVNYLAPYLLTRRLVPVLQASAERNKRPARVVNVASTAMGGGQVDFSDLQLTRHFSGWQAYANSKLMNILFSDELARRLTGSGVVSNALCPGLIDTNFFHTNSLFAERYPAMRRHMRPPDEGALVPLYLATAPEAGEISGQFFVRDGRDGRHAVPLGLDPGTARRLWEVSEQLVGDRLEATPEPG